MYRLDVIRESWGRSSTVVLISIVATAGTLAALAFDIAYLPAQLIFPDEHRFLHSAIGINAGDGFSSAGSRAWEMPGTAIFFSTFVWLFGPENAIIPIRCVQAGMHGLQVLMLGRLASHLFGVTSAQAAAILAAFYPFLLFYQSLLLSETLFTTLLIAAFFLLYRWRRNPSDHTIIFVLANAVFALATLSKATLTLAGPVLASVTVASVPGTLRRKAAMVLIAFGTFAALMSPWWFRNLRMFNAPVFFTTSAAQNLYLGNNPRNADGRSVDWTTSSEPGLVNSFNNMDEISRSDAFRAAALTYIRSDIAAFAKRMVNRFVRFWDLIPNASEFRSLGYRLASLLSFGPVLILALFGAYSLRKRFSEFLPIYLLVSYFTAIHISTIASLRYRAPLEPFLILLASKTIGDIIELMTRRSHKLTKHAAPFASSRGH